MQEPIQKLTESKPKIAAIVGSTAGGKTSLAIALAKELGGEIVSCDSMQIYRGMDIGTAKPTVSELNAVPHHMIDIANPTASLVYSCADYVKDARAATEDILAKGKLPILCGGTGLYLDAYLRGGSFEDSETDNELRECLAAVARNRGNDTLHAMLREIDPESAEQIHPNNVKRVIRAIEIYETTGRKKSELDKESRLPESAYDALVIGIRYNDRGILYDRIEKRVDEMIASGLIEETIRLRKLGVFEKCPTASQAIGYKELFPYLDGHATLEEVTNELKCATRRYAKRQLTWFSARPYVNWIDADIESDGVWKTRDFEDIVNNAKKLFQDRKFCGIL